MAASNSTVREVVSTEQPTHPDRCPDCNGRPRPDGIDTVCQQCGLVVDSDPIDRGPDWRIYGPDDRDKKHAAPVMQTRQGKHLGSEIGHASERDTLQLRRVNQHHQRARMPTKQAQNHRYAVNEIERVVDAGEWGDAIATEARQLYKTLIDEMKLVGYNLDTIAASCVYAALRCHQRGRSPDDVAEVARSDSRAIGRRYRFVLDQTGVIPPMPSLEARIRTVAGKLDVSAQTVQRACERVQDLDKSIVSSGSHSTLAAGLLWRLADNVTQADAADAAHVSRTGVRKRMRQFDDV